MIGCLILKFGGKNEPREWKVLSIQALLKPGDRWTPQKRNSGRRPRRNSKAGGTRKQRCHES